MTGSHQNADLHKPFSEKQLLSALDTALGSGPANWTYWSIFFDPENSSLKVYSNLPESLEDKKSQKKMIHDANNLLSRLIMQLEFLKTEGCHTPEVVEQIAGISHTVDEIAAVLRKR